MNLLPSEKLEKRLPGIAIKAETDARLKKLSKDYGISVSELVRRAIDIFLSEIANYNSNNSNIRSEREKNS